MFKQSIENYLIVVLVILVVLLSYFLVIGFNRTAVQARNNVPESRADTFRPSLAIEDKIEEQQLSEVSLAYQDVFTNPNVLEPPEGEEQYDGEVVEAIGINGQSASIGGQSTGTGAEFIPASAFRHDGNSPASEYEILTFGDGIGGYIRNNSAGYMCISGPVYLPNGATITWFRQYFVDSNSSLEMWTAVLWRRKLSSPPTTTADVVADLDFLFFNPIDSIFVWRGSSANIVTAGSETVSNEYGYYITYCFDPNTDMSHRIYGFEVDYTLP